MHQVVVNSITYVHDFPKALKKFHEVRTYVKLVGFSKASGME